MTREETKHLLMTIAALYSNFHPQNMTFTINAWNAVLADMDAKEMNTALLAYVRNDTTGFPPSVGQIIRAYNTLTDTSQSGLEAWGLVSMALRNGTYNAESEFCKLPKLVQKAIGSAGQLHAWAIDTDFNESVVQSNFIKSYSAVCERDRMMQQMPERIRNLISETTQMQIAEVKTNENI